VRGTWAVLALALAGPTVATFLYFVVLASPAELASKPNPWLQGFYTGSKVLQFSLPVLWLGWWQGQRLRPGPVRWDGWRLGVGFGFLVLVAGLGLYFGALRGAQALNHCAVQLRAKVSDFGLATPAGFIVLGTFLSLIHSLLEEYYWRWFVFGELRRLVPLGTAIVVSGVAFMAHHVVVVAVYFPGYFLSWTVPLSLAVAIGGMFWAWLYHRTGSIWAAWLSHLVIDAAIMIVGYDLLFA